MKTYTVLVLRPDYMTGNYGTDTYTTHVEAVSVPQAQEKAQHKAWVRDCTSANGETDYYGSADDYAVLFVAEGQHNNLMEE